MKILGYTKMNSKEKFNFLDSNKLCQKQKELIKRINE